MGPFEQVTSRFLAALHHDGNEIEGLCNAATEVLSVPRAAISVDADEAGLQTWCASDEIAAAVEELQATLGEGPGVSAIRHSAPVLVPDLSLKSQRWPGFLSAVADKGITGGMYALPLHLGSVRLGVLDVYGSEPGDLDRSTLAAGLHVADLITTLLLSGGPQYDARRADSPRPLDGTLRLKDLETTDSVEEWWWEASTTAGRDIHQAAGMVIAQAGTSARDAYALLRAYAYAEGLSLTEVAERVVRRQLRFGPEND
ncbi:GAF and ANTAR domain-containing protein [Nocardia sp. NPDC048505]|uniref:GAF and ANTAR domain-containing protein n=1 Tax=unclassified Nocardia TaxID=2637762 RepID=UPI0033EA4008